MAVKQIGNSVPPQLARIMAVAIRQQVFSTGFPFDLSLLEETEELGFRKRKKFYLMNTEEKLSQRLEL